MDQATAQALADGYAAFSTTGDLSVLRMFSSDFYDNVSGRTGLDIFPVVALVVEHWAVRDDAALLDSVAG